MIARTFTVPAGKPLLLPIINFVDLEPAELDPPPITLGDRENPNNAAGYWLMIEGLVPGPHTLHLEGVSSAFTPDANCCTNFEIPGFSPNLTLNIVVVPEPASAVPMLVGFVGVRWGKAHCPAADPAYPE
jgi:hypothetical protein